MKKMLQLLLIFVGIVSVTSTITLPAKTQVYPTETILEQAFDEEITGYVPEGWVVTYQQFGSFTVDDSVFYGSSGKSGKFVDSSLAIGGFPFPYRTFSQQSGKITVEFAMKPTGSARPNAGLMFYVDNGNPQFPDVNALWNGANINFLYGDITCEEGQWPNLVHHYLQSYSANTWYTIKMTIDIPSNTYDIYIDGSLRASAARFRSDTGEHITQLSRIHLGAASDLTPIGYIDDIRITKLVSLIPATIDVDPDTLNLKSNGEWVTGYIELPKGYNVSNIDVNSILLNGTIPVNMEAPKNVGDYDLDSVPDLMVKFDRATIIQWLDTTDCSVDTGKYCEINLTITGTVAGTQFSGTDKIKILKR